MRINIKITSPDPISLPVSYNYLVQGLIYSLIAHDKSYANELHDEGKSLKNHHYKLFSFSQLIGKYQIKGKNIIFTSPIYLEISTIDDVFLQKLVEGILYSETIRLGRQEVRVKSYRYFNDKLNQSSYKIRMLSPITVHKSKGNQTIYFNPLEEDFKEGLIGNFKRKYEAFYGEAPNFDFSIKPLNFSLKNKFVTSYKNYFITAWKGDYELTGDHRALDFLYQTGLGEKNSMGFGLFKIINRGE